MTRKKSPRAALGIKWGEGSVIQRGEKWQARWPEERADRSITWRAKTFATQDEAVDHLRDVAREKKERRYVARDHLTVADMVTAYLERGRLRWTSNTLATYRQITQTHLVPALGRRNVHDLKGSDVQRWVDRMATSGAISASVIENALHILSGAYREALRFGAVTTNPAVGVKPPPRERTQMKTWTAAEARRVLSDPEATPYTRALYQLALTTGMRPGELRALQWGDVDLSRGVVQIRRSMTRDEAFRAVMGTDTKTLGSRRTVALTASTVDALTRHRTDQQERKRYKRGWEDQDIVFDNGKGRWLSQQSWKRLHDKMCARLGVTQIRLHDIRHSAATLLLERNVHPKVVADILGHSSVTMTLDRYSHVSDSLQRSAVDALDSHLSEKD